MSFWARTLPRRTKMPLRMSWIAYLLWVWGRGRV